MISDIQANRIVRNVALELKFSVHELNALQAFANNWHSAWESGLEYTTSTVATQIRNAARLVAARQITWNCSHAMPKGPVDFSDVSCSECRQLLPAAALPGDVVDHKVFDTAGELEFIELAHAACRPDWKVR